MRARVSRGALLMSVIFVETRAEIIPPLAGAIYPREREREWETRERDNIKFARLRGFRATLFFRAGFFSTPRLFSREE